MAWDIRHGDALTVLRSLPESSAQACVTSPPYWGLRDYGADGQIGLESTPGEYVARLVEVFRDVRRVLKDDGTLWLNLGDSYAANTKGSGGTKGKQPTNAGSFYSARFDLGALKHKDLVGIPWRVAFALQADGWYLRSDIIWHKPNPMPESVTDRPTKAHEYLFLLAKSERYYYNAEAIKEPGAMRVSGNTQHKYVGTGDPLLRTKEGLGKIRSVVYERVNRRTVWTVATQPFGDAHFATFPPALIEPCILAGSKPGDLILDPFNGAGTTGLVALRLGRNYLGIELNPGYVEMSRRRIVDDAPLLNQMDASS